MDAFTYYNTKIQDVDATLDEEYTNLVNERMKWRAESIAPTPRDGDVDDTPGSQFSPQDLYELFVPTYVRQTIFGDRPDFCYGTGIVTFKSITVKQSGTSFKIL